MKYFLFTCHHVISKNDVNNKIAIDFFYGKNGKKEKEKKKTIILDRSERFIACFDYKIDNCDDIIDATAIEIKEKDEIPEDKYLIADLSYKYGYDIYEQKQYFLAGYPYDPLYQKQRHISSGLILDADRYIFKHNIDTRSGSSGAPICQIENLRVVGMHNIGCKGELLNYGVFIGVIIDELEKQLENTDIIINESKVKNENIKTGLIPHEKEKKSKEILSGEFKGLKDKISKEVVNNYKEKSKISINKKAKPNKYFVTLDDYINGEYLSFYKKIIYYYNNQNEKNFRIFNEDFRNYVSKNKDKIKGSSYLIYLDSFQNVDKNYKAIIEDYIGPSTFYTLMNFILTEGNVTQLEKFSYFIGGFLRALDKAGKPIKDKCQLINEEQHFYFTLDELNIFRENIDNIISFKYFFYVCYSEKIRSNAFQNDKSNYYKVLFIIDYEYNSDNEFDCYDIGGLCVFGSDDLFLYRIFTFFKIKNVEIEKNNNIALITLKSIGKQKNFESKLLNLKSGNKIVYNSNKRRLEIN